MKSGTTWLSRVVTGHPEAHVFNLTSDRFDNLNELVSEQKVEVGQNVLYARRNLNPDHDLASRLFEHNNNMKLVVVLRDPIARFMSHLQHHVVKMTAIGGSLHPSITVKRNLFYDSFDVNCYIHQCDFSSRNMPPFLKKSLYYDNLRDYISLFGRRQFHVLLSEALFDRPYEVIKDIFEFCEMSQLDKESISSLLQAERNAASDMRRRLGGLLPQRKKVFIPLDEEAINVLNDLFDKQRFELEAALDYKVGSTD